MCNKAKETHTSLLQNLPPVEKEKHDIWFKAKMLSVIEFMENVNEWLANTGIPKTAEGVEEEGEVKPDDSISNVV